MSHVIFLLKSDIDDSLRNWFTDSIKELGFSDNDLQFWCKVHSVDAVVVNLVDFLLQNEFVEKLDSLISILVFPFVENLLLVVLIKILG